MDSAPRGRKRPTDEACAGLGDEIRMLRATMRRVMAMAEEGRSLPELLRVLEGLAQASARLATLLKTQQALDSGQSVAGALQTALAEVLREMNAEAGRER